MFDVNAVKTPCYVTDTGLLRKNLEILKGVEERTGAKILLAQKAFSMYSVYPTIKEYISGAAASGIYEAKLAREEMGGEVHTFCPAFKDEDFGEIMEVSDHIVFNSFSQWKKFRGRIKNNSKKVSCGIRINPEYSEIETDIYNPCFTGSRLGTTLSAFEENELDGIEGLHFHTMCEQGAETLERTLVHVEEKFGKYLSRMKWINFGGGHHITKEGYNIPLLESCIRRISERYGVQVYLEPGEAVALNCGFLVSEVMDFVENGAVCAIMDTSAACHMPDVLEMPYRPFIIGSGEAGEKPYTYRLGGPTCLAGDVIGDYSFDKPLEVGDRLVFCDMAIYSMVKNNTFNGMPLPWIYLASEDGGIKLVRKFGYEDFKSRL